jgi:hypothetical protein
MTRNTSVEPTKEVRTNVGEPGTGHVRGVNNGEDVVGDSNVLVPSGSCTLATRTSKAAQGCGRHESADIRRALRLSEAE